MAITDLVPALQDLHRTFHDTLVGSLHAFQDAGSATAFVPLVAAGFLYGMLHAIGPGHGKVVIGAYMFADGHTLRRGLVITALSSLLQAGVAIALVLILFFALGLAHASVGATESPSAWMDYLSFGLLAAVGATLIARGTRFLRAGRRGTGEHLLGANQCRCSSCAHHAPTARQLRKAHGVLGTAAVIASIGMRPCSGAILLMSLACLAGEIWAGIAGTLAMGVGTGLSVGAVAVAAVQSRKWLLNLVSMTEAKLATATGFASIFGGVALIMSVAVLLAVPLSPIHTHAAGASVLHVHKR
jgi:ABC-type nickel/cobalt efflux system permease component RcnA